MPRNVQITAKISEAILSIGVTSYGTRIPLNNTIFSSRQSSTMSITADSI